MILSTHQTYIGSKSYQGILKLSIVKEFHNLVVNLEVYEILSKDKTILSALYQSCLDDPNNPNLLKTISTDLKYSKVLNLRDCEILKDYLKFSEKLDIKKNDTYSISFFNELTIPLKSNQIIRLYYFISSFYQNYHVLDSMIRFVTQTLSTNKPKQSGFIEINDTRPESPPPSEIILPKDQPEIKNTTDVKDEVISSILSCCVNPLIKISLLHYIFNYFYTTQTDISISEDQKIKINSSNIFPSRFNFDINFVKSLIQSVSDLNIEQVNLAVDKLLNILLTMKENTNIHISSIAFLLFIYYMKQLSQLAPDVFNNKLEDYLYSEEKQTKVLNYFTDKFSKEYSSKLRFEINDSAPKTDVINIDGENYSNSLLTDLIEKYKYIIPVSSEEFVKLILQDWSKIDETIPKITLNNKKIINIDNLIRKDTLLNNKIKTTLFDPDDILNIDEQVQKFNENILLFYQDFGDRIISKSYKLLLDYIKNPTVIFGQSTDDIPLEVKNSFNMLSTKVLLKENFNKENIYTFNYWKILHELIPNFNLFSENIKLYIIFQLIIPFYYEVYRVNEFIDVLL